MMGPVTEGSDAEIEQQGSFDVVQHEMDEPMREGSFDVSPEEPQEYEYTNGNGNESVNSDADGWGWGWSEETKAAYGEVCVIFDLLNTST
ncbi:hypothetical protein H0H87_005391 [Tephrocybe sp. NHM501043]|nr:hypothetical protein H0H87_005391 [Tephrocybe sp. NHM501043]